MAVAFARGPPIPAKYELNHQSKATCVDARKGGV
jgi:hypothetical protein